MSKKIAEDNHFQGREIQNSKFFQVTIFKNNSFKAPEKKIKNLYHVAKEFSKLLKYGLYFKIFECQNLEFR